MDTPLIQWLSNHLKDAVILASALLIAKYGRRVWGWGTSALGLYVGAQKEIQSTQSRLADGYKDERDECWRQKNTLTSHLLECRREILRLQKASNMHKDASAQDRAYIRALERECEENKIEYEPIRDRIIDKYLAEQVWEGAEEE